MNYLFVGSDRKSFEESSNVSGRYVAFSKFADRIDAVVPTWRSLNLPKSRDIMPNVTIHGTNGWTKIDGFLRTVILLTKLAQQKKPDLIIARDPFEYGIVALIASKLSGVPLVLQLHTDVASPWFKYGGMGNRFRQCIVRWVCRHATGLRVISRSMRDSVIAAGIMPADRVTWVAPMYSDVWSGNEITEVRNKNRILLVSRLEFEKDIPVAFHAIKKICDTGKFPDLNVVILGSGSEKTNLENLARELGIEKHIEFAGWIEAPWKLFQSSQVFLQTGLYEGFGMSIVEAYAHGCFCVSTDVGIARELVTTDRDGGICPVKNDACLAEKMMNALEQENLSQEEQEVRKQKIKTIIPYQTFDEYAGAFMGWLDRATRK